MKRIALLGANSQIGSDLALHWAGRADLQLDLYSRQPDMLAKWADGIERARPMACKGYDELLSAREDYDALINFVGVGDPAKAVAMGASIIDVTHHYDSLALSYLERAPACRYVFLSSGAVYGRNFAEPVDDRSVARIEINQIGPQDYYSVAKLAAEVRHRSTPHRNIVDLRVFNMFSRRQDVTARFFITDIIRAIEQGHALEVDAAPMTRDYLHPGDFAKLVDSVLQAEPANAAVDAYSRAPIGKFELLESMQARYGLQWTTRPGPAGINATGAKPNYYSLNRRAGAFGYEPGLTSLETIHTEASAMLEQRTPDSTRKARQ